MKKETPIVSFVLPCYNEEKVIDITAEELLKLIDSLIKKGIISQESFVYFIDDGSKDKTWELISKFHCNHKNIKGLKLSRNVGHQKALLAGLLNVYTKADCIISMDADMQDDISVIEEMIQKYKAGYEVVYGVRNDRESDTLIKKYTAQGFYKLIKFMGVNVIYNHADFRCTSSRVIESLSTFQEVNLFLRAMFPLIGYNYTTVEYSRGKRQGGESKYPIKKMLAFAWEGVTSFTIQPLRYITILGLFTIFITIVLAIWTFVVTVEGKSIPGWASTVLPIYFIGGVQLISIGILGEYVAKIYQEVKRRPKYFKDTELF